MQDELEDNQEEYRSLAHGDLCDLLSTINFKDNRKRSSTQIKRLETSRAASNSDSKKSVRLMCKKRVRTGFLPNRKHQGGEMPNHHEIHWYCALCKKAGIPEKKYMSHISENCFGKLSYQQPTKLEMGGSIGNRADAVKHCKKYEHKWRKDIKVLKKQNKML